jgi:YhcH/YjgK/YiaL family protein
MKKHFFITSIFILTVCFLYNLNVSAQLKPAETWTKEKAAQWFQKGQWLNGLKLKAHPSINQVEFAVQYHKNKALWDKAMAYLKETDLQKIAPGKYPIAGDSLFATVIEGPTKKFENTKWEAHKKYIDIQYIIKGKEKMGKAPVSKAKVLTPYDEGKDVAFYTSNDGQFFEVEAGTLLIFFPQDAHRTTIKVNGCDADKKIVLKIRMD